MPRRQDDPNPTRGSLIHRLKDWQDQKSWKEFYDIYWRLVHSAALKAGLTQTEAEDVVQDTFAALAHKMEEFNYDPEVGSFKAYLLRCTQWRIKDQFRKRKDQHIARRDCSTKSGTATIARIADPAPFRLEELWEEEWETTLFNAALDRVKQEVKAKHFQIFDLYVLRKWPVTKIAETVGVKPGMVHLVKHRISRLIQKEVALLKSKHL